MGRATRWSLRASRNPRTDWISSPTSRRPARHKNRFTCSICCNVYCRQLDDDHTLFSSCYDGFLLLPTLFSHTKQRANKQTKKHYYWFRSTVTPETKRQSDTVFFDISRILPSSTPTRNRK